MFYFFKCYNRRIDIWQAQSRAAVRCQQTQRHSQGYSGVIVKFCASSSKIKLYHSLFIDNELKNFSVLFVLCHYTLHPFLSRLSKRIWISLTYKYICIGIGEISGITKKNFYFYFETCDLNLCMFRKRCS